MKNNILALTIVVLSTSIATASDGRLSITQEQKQQINLVQSFLMNSFDQIFTKNIQTDSKAVKFVSKATGKTLAQYPASVVHIADKLVKYGEIELDFSSDFPQAAAAALHENNIDKTSLNTYREFYINARNHPNADENSQAFAFCRAQEQVADLLINTLDNEN